MLAGTQEALGLRKFPAQAGGGHSRRAERQRCTRCDGDGQWQVCLVRTSVAARAQPMHTALAEFARQLLRAYFSTIFEVGALPQALSHNNLACLQWSSARCGRSIVCRGWRLFARPLLYIYFPPSPCSWLLPSPAQLPAPATHQRHDRHRCVSAHQLDGRPGWSQRALPTKQRKTKRRKFRMPASPSLRCQPASLSRQPACAMRQVMALQQRGIACDYLCSTHNACAPIEPPCAPSLRQPSRPATLPSALASFPHPSSCCLASLSKFVRTLNFSNYI